MADPNEVVSHDLHGRHVTWEESLPERWTRERFESAKPFELKCEKPEIPEAARHGQGVWGGSSLLVSAGLLLM